MHMDYDLKVDPRLNPFTDQPSVNHNSFRINNGKYYNFGKATRVPGSEDLQKQYAEALHERIEEIVKEESKFLSDVWFEEIPYFFNRRAYGMLKNNGACRTLLSKPRTLLIPRSYHKLSAPSVFRKSSNRLRGALKVVDITTEGAALGIEELSRNRDSIGGGACRDYVQILKSGVSPQPKAPFNPAIDKRMTWVKGNFCGVSSAYWKKWDRFFRNQLRQSEARMNSRIEQEMSNLQRLKKRESSRVYSGKKTESGSIKQGAEQNKTPEPQKWRRNIKTKR